MARGIGEHLRPVTQLGPEGAHWLPNADASWKPLFPALVALGDALGLAPLSTAQLIIALSSALLVVASGAIVWLYGRSVWATLVTLALVALSPSVRHWQAFIGPDALAPALALSAAALALAGQPIACGLLVGLAAGARPEWGVVALVLLIAAIMLPRHRRAALRALGAAAGSYLTLLLLLWPPIEIGAVQLLIGLGSVTAIGIALGIAIAWDGTWSRVVIGGAVGLALAAGIACAIAQERLHGLALLVRDDPWIVLAALALALGIWNHRTRRVSLAAAAALLVLVVVYLTKNPGSERYLSQLVAPAAVVVGIAVSGLPRRLQPAIAAGAVVLALGGAVLAPAHLRGPDPLLPIAVALPKSTSLLIVGQPEGISFYRPDLSLTPYVIGARGLIVSDPIARDYAPSVGVEGTVVKTIPLDFAVRHRNGSLDLQEIRITRGRLVANE